MANLNGIICINKPQDFTSFDVVAKMRGITQTRKAGHAGTLDPMATGVLPIFFGNATKACDIMPDDTKCYVADFQIGIQTDTYDIWGKIMSEQQTAVTAAQIEDKLNLFRGEISQIPPMYSAVQVNGQRLYDIARQGLTVERKARTVTVDRLQLLSFDEQKQCGKLEVSCSKGTYIRSICHDLGQELGCGATMTGLVRTRAGVFTLEDCITLEQAQQCADKQDFSDVLLDTEKIFDGLPKIKLNEIQSRKFINGMRLDLNRVYHTKTNGFHAVFDYKKRFMGLASLDFDKMELVIEKMFLERESF